MNFTVMMAKRHQYDTYPCNLSMASDTKIQTIIIIKNIKEFIYFKLFIFMSIFAINSALY